MYFKDPNNALFFDPSDEVIQKHSLSSISKEEFDSILEVMNTPTEADLKQQRIAELKQFLSDTDHKALNDYTPKEGEDMDKVHADRIAARDEIRLLEAEV